MNSLLTETHTVAVQNVAVTDAIMITRLDVDDPLVTVYERCAPKTRAAYFSLSPIGPL